jgi:hypothetical protein
MINLPIYYVVAAIIAPSVTILAGFSVWTVWRAWRRLERVSAWMAASSALFYVPVAATVYLILLNIITFTTVTP